MLLATHTYSQPSRLGVHPPSAPNRMPRQYTDWEYGAAMAAAAIQTGRRHSPDRYIAVAVQQVYVGRDGNINAPMAARVSLVDYRGLVIYDTYVKSTQPVVDYRTRETGLDPSHFEKALPFHEVQCHVGAIIRNKIIVGYGIEDFLSLMGISHPTIDTRDTALFLPFRKTLRTQDRVPLYTLVRTLMAREFGCGYEEPLEHARAALDLFRSTEEMWEGLISSASWPCALPPTKYANLFT